MNRGGGSRNVAHCCSYLFRVGGGGGYQFDLDFHFNYVRLEPDILLSWCIRKFYIFFYRCEMGKKYHTYNN